MNPNPSLLVVVASSLHLIPILNQAINVLFSHGISRCFPPLQFIIFKKVEPCATQVTPSQALPIEQIISLTHEAPFLHSSFFLWVTQFDKSMYDIHIALWRENGTRRLIQTPPKQGVWFAVPNTSLQSCCWHIIKETYSLCLQVSFLFISHIYNLKNISKFLPSNWSTTAIILGWLHCHHNHLHSSEIIGLLNYL